MTQKTTQKGQRGFELDAHLSFARPLPRAEAGRLVSAWGLRPTLYPVHPDAGGAGKAGEADEIRAVRLTGALDRDTVLVLLRQGLEGGLLKSAELGRRGFLRSPSGSTDYVPWRRTKVLRKDAWSEVALEDGVRYVLE